MLVIRATLESPEPRVALGQHLLGVAHAAIDISDGLTQDLGHLLKASGVGAVLDIDRLPIHPALSSFEPSVVEQAVLHGGDVYELCFTAAASRRARIEAIGQSLGLSLMRVGQTRAHLGLVGHTQGRLVELASKGFDHFSGDGT